MGAVSVVGRCEVTLSLTHTHLHQLFGTDVPTPVPAVLYRGASGVAAAMGVDTGLSHAVGQLSLTAVIGKGQRLQPEALLQSVVASMRVSFEGTETRQHRPIVSTHLLIVDATHTLTWWLRARVDVFAAKHGGGDQA